MVPEVVSSHKAWASDSYANINNSSHNMFFSLRKLILWQGIFVILAGNRCIFFFSSFSPIFWKAVPAYEKANTLKMLSWLLVSKDSSDIPALGSAAFLHLYLFITVKLVCLISTCAWAATFFTNFKAESGDNNNCSTSYFLFSLKCKWKIHKCLSFNWEGQFKL